MAPKPTGVVKLTRLLDGPYWAWCWVAYHLVLVWPHGRLDRVWMWLLPFAGFYGYHDPSWMSWRRSENAATATLQVIAYEAAAPTERVTRTDGRGVGCDNCHGFGAFEVEQTVGDGVTVYGEAPCPKCWTDPEAAPTEGVGETP